MQGVEENVLISVDLVLHWELLVLGSKYIPLFVQPVHPVQKKKEMINAPHIDHQGVHYI